jgi:hypothetical protein
MCSPIRLPRWAKGSGRLDRPIGQTLPVPDREAFFIAQGDDTFVPRPHARSPWAANMLHGRLLAALATRQLERDHLGPTMRLARLTVDMFRVVPLAPVVINADVVRDGRRLRAVDLVVSCEGRSVLRAGALLLASGDAPPGRVWSRPAWDETPPDGPALARTSEADAMGSPDLRVIGGGFDGPGPYRAWVREPWPLVDGEELSPMVRAVMAADVGSPLSSWSDAGLQYINADLTVSLVRSPAGEWIGLEVVDHLDDSGIGIGSCRLYDRHGPVGSCQVTGVARAFGT